MKSLITLCEYWLNILSGLICDGIDGFIDANVFSLSFTIVTLLSVLFIELCIVLLFLFITVNEILGLFFSKVEYSVLLKL